MQQLQSLQAHGRVLSNRPQYNAATGLATPAARLSQPAAAQALAASAPRVTWCRAATLEPAAAADRHVAAAQPPARAADPAGAPAVGTIVQGVVKTVAPKVTIALPTGLVGELPATKISIPSGKRSRPPFTEGEQVWAMVEKSSPLILNTAALEVVPDEVLHNKAAVFSRAAEFAQHSHQGTPEELSSQLGQEQEAQAPAGSISAYSNWLGSQLLRQFIAPRTPGDPLRAVTRRAPAWHQVHAGQLLQARVTRVVKELVWLRVDSLGIHGAMHISQISSQRMEVQQLPTIFKPDTQVQVVVKKVEAPLVPGALPKVYFATRDLEAEPGLAATNLQRYNQQAAAQNVRLQQGFARKRLQAAIIALAAAKQAEANRQRTSDLGLVRGSLVAGTVVAHNEYGAEVTLQGQGPRAQRLLLHHRNMSEFKVSREEVRKLLPLGTEVVMQVIEATVRGREGQTQVRPALATAPLEQQPGEFKADPQAVMRRAQAALAKQRQQQKEGEQPAGEVLQFASAPRFQRLQEALLALMSVPTTALATLAVAAAADAAASDTQAPAAGAKLVQRYLKCVEQMEAVLSSALGSSTRLPWAAAAAPIHPVMLRVPASIGLPADAGDVTELQVRTARAESAWQACSPDRRAVLALQLGLRFRAQALRMLQAGQQPGSPSSSSSSSSSPAQAYDADAVALVGATRLLAVQQLELSAMGSMLQGWGRAAMALQAAHPPSWERAYGQWVAPLSEQLLQAMTAEGLNAEQLLGSGLLEALLCVELLPRHRAASPGTYQQQLAVVFGRLVKRMLPPGPGRMALPFQQQVRDALEQQGSSLGDGQERGASSTSSGSDGDAGQRVVALHHALALLQIALVTGYMPSAKWWSAFFKGLLQHIPQVWQPDASLSLQEVALVKQAKAAAARVCGSPAQPSSNTQPEAP